jgi:hypothetical protein
MASLQMAGLGAIAAMAVGLAAVLASATTAGWYRARERRLLRTAARRQRDLRSATSSAFGAGYRIGHEQGRSTGFVVGQRMAIEFKELLEP